MKEKEKQYEMQLESRPSMRGFDEITIFSHAEGVSSLSYISIKNEEVCTRVNSGENMSSFSSND